MSAVSAALMGRRAAEKNMVDTCTVDRAGDTETTDPESGVVTESNERIYPTPAEIESGNPGKCRVQQTMAQSNDTVSAGHTFTVQGSSVQVPVGAGPFRVGDIIRMTAARSNPALVGNVYRVAELFEKSDLTAQRLRVEEVTG